MSCCDVTLGQIAADGRETRWTAERDQFEQRGVVFTLALHVLAQCSEVLGTIRSAAFTGCFSERSRSIKSRASDAATAASGDERLAACGWRLA
jgi:hypothetical protein